MSPLARAPLLRLLRSRRAWLVLGGWMILAIVPGLLERTKATVHGADHALLGFYAAVTLPFLAYTAIGAILAREGLGTSTTALANFGAPAARVAMWSVAVAIVTSALLGGGTGAVVDLVAHGAEDPPLAGDMVRAFVAGALGGAAYAAYFALGAAFGARGFGRSVLLVLDWVLGSDVGAGALVTPRAHVRSLLGGGAPLEVSGLVSDAALAAMVIVFTWLAVRRAGRARWGPARR